ncbi:hypothetical protein MVQ21_03075 [Fusobacterium necrophorum]|uniref:hypothetical protein n=1 Tax=Fusobacterium necrophorum TaxID=859 RepID=UPI00254C5170|nr:hypothetical protein [Fusobacterium necrophorum]MDK4495290.1 hypothetical protein [Fusobacterium necrophorum]MDK4509343.1 hypothetical protein [Fusobacterium necrophorum]
MELKEKICDFGEFLIDKFIECCEKVNKWSLLKKILVRLVVQLISSIIGVFLGLLIMAYLKAK